MDATDHWFNWPDSVAGPFRITVEWGNVEGRADCIAFEIRTMPGQPPVPLTTTLLRSIPLTGLVDEKRQVFAAQPPIPSPTWRELWEERKAKGGRPPLSDDFLREVARVYSAAWQAGGTPTKAVQEQLGPTQYGTAARWVMKARVRGFLGATSPGKSGGVPPAPRRGRAR